MSRINPIKWTTKKVNELLVQINNTGVVPRYNPFHNNDSSLFSADLNFGFTEDELLDRARVMEDIFYFAKTHAFIKNADTGEIEKIRELRPYQKNVLYHFIQHRMNVLMQSRQSGKCVHPFTQIVVMEKDKEPRKLPIFEVFYQTAPKLSLFDKIIYLILRTSYRLETAS